MTKYTAHITWTPAGDYDPFAIDFGGAAVSAGADRINVTLTAEGPTLIAALDSAITRCLEVIPGDLVDAEIMTLAEHDRRLAEPARPPLVGIAEIAEILGVSRQRASQLQTKPDFPAPTATLRSGPVWYAGDITRFADSWARRGGRPAKPSTVGSGSV